MKFEQAKEKFHEAETLHSTVLSLRRDVKSLEHGIDVVPAITLYFSNSLNINCDSDLSNVILKLALQEKRAELKQLEREFNDMWKMKRGGKNGE